MAKRKKQSQRQPLKPSYSQLSRAVSPSPIQSPIRAHEALLGLPRARDLLPSRPDMLGLPRGLPTGSTFRNSRVLRGPDTFRSQRQPLMILRGAMPRAPKPLRLAMRVPAALGPSLMTSGPKGRTICQTRSIRSQVLHALGIAGRRGVGYGKSQRRSYLSNYTCR